MNDEILAKAIKPSAFSRSFTIYYEGQQYILEADSVLSRRFILMDPEYEIGSVDPESIFNSEAAINLPDEFPVYVKTFMFWLVMILWKRASDASHSSP